METLRGLEACALETDSRENSLRPSNCSEIICGYAKRRVDFQSVLFRTD